MYQKFRGLYFVFFLLSSFIFTSVFTKAYASTDKPHILLISLTDRVGSSAWYKGIDEYSKLSAEALDVDLEHFAIGTLREKVLPLLEERLSQDPKPDYMIFGNQLNLGVDLLQMAENHEIKSFLYIEPLSDEDFKTVEGPRGKFKSWIGQLIPNDEQVGYDLANYLINDAKRRKTALGDPSKVKLVAVSGRRSTPAAYLRQQGLIRAVKERDDVELLQTVSGRWASDVAARKYLGLKGRYGRIDAVWNANDSMAMGVVSALDQNDFRPSIGGVDWIDDAVQALTEEKMVATMGGHVFDIAYVIALIKNYHEGTDFAKASGTYSLQSKLMPLTRDNLSEFESFLKYKNTDKVDFQAGFAGLIKRENLENITIQRFVKQSMVKVQ